jgi:uncharacterized protein (TIGR03435 family)
MRRMALVICFWFSPGGLAFGQGEGAKPAFEVASVKRAAPAPPSTGMVRGGPGTDDPGQITYLNTPLRLALMRAYGLASLNQLEGPDWLGDRYDIAAKIPPGTTKDQFQKMLQNLLTERFQVTAHHEIRKSDGYRLIVGKNGSKLKESKPGDAPTPIPDGFPPLAAGQTVGINIAGDDGTFRLTARQQTLTYLDGMLGVQLQATIVDQTGLTDRYDFNLGFVPARFLDPDHPGRFPDVRTAVEEQLGLKLVAGTVALDVVVIDKGSKEPLDN